MVDLWGTSTNTLKVEERILALQLLSTKSQKIVMVYDQVPLAVPCSRNPHIAMRRGLYLHPPSQNRYFSWMLCAYLL